MAQIKLLNLHLSGALKELPNAELKGIQGAADAVFTPFSIYDRLVGSYNAGYISSIAGIQEGNGTYRVVIIGS